jgi:hypothetical protein
MISISGISEVFTELDELVGNKAALLDRTKKELLSSLKVATPVDTGKARDSWALTPTGIENSVEYIDELNGGSSKQAPVYFIERTVLSNPVVTANGKIVTDR